MNLCVADNLHRVIVARVPSVNAIARLQIYTATAETLLFCCSVLLVPSVCLVHIVLKSQNSSLATEGTEMGDTRPCVFLHHLWH